MGPNSRALIGVGLAFTFLLGSCAQDSTDKSEFTDAQRDEITDIAGDAAGDAIADDEKILELEQSIEEKDQKIQEIEGRIYEIERRLEM
ncbi:hypothetical protein [Sphingorhabdus sp. EL138]|uniref:hypothetical protein n=1 Tax=Sphingorhabdus sp. EL138 TaxID=2073156 RepID=UPI0025E783CC|nr:hypothetical protein [Sphingorhabdus sp. EL138]